MSGRCTVIGKDLEPSLNHSWEEPTSNWLQRKGTHWNDSGNPGHKTLSKYKDLSDWTQEIRSQQFSISHPHCFIPSSLMVLAWQFSSLRLVHLLRESKLPTLGFYILKASPIRKENIEDIRVQGCSLNDPPHIMCTVLDKPSCQGHGVLWLALHGHWPWPRSTHDCQFPPELHTWSWGEAEPKKVTGR